MQSPQAQAQTIQALQHIAQNRWRQGREAIASTRDPLASKLYMWLQYTRKDTIENPARLAQFIRKNPEWPLMSRLHRKAEKHISQNMGPQEVVAWFEDYPPKTAEGLDQYLQALLVTGRTDTMQSFLSNWWASNTLSRDDQRRIFRKYKQYLTRDSHIKRFDTLLYNGQYTNAKAIANVLGPGYVALANARIALAQEKKAVNALINKVPAALQNDPGLLYERLRWRRRNDLNDGAMDILRNMPPAQNIGNLRAWWRERHILIRRLLEQKRYNQAYILASGHQQKSGLPFAQAEWLAGWLALRFTNKPIEAYKRFFSLYSNVKSPISRARGAYWTGRAAEYFQDQSISQSYYKLAARYPTVFYGQLANKKLKQGDSLPAGAPPELSKADQLSFGKKELVQAAVLFSKAGFNDEARYFLKAFVNHESTARAYRYAAELAIELGQYYSAIQIAKDATKKGLFLTAQSYPVLSADKMRNIRIEKALVHGIIRQESLFDAKAKSRVGALGMMQLMPATAREVAKKLGLGYSKARLTADPAYNIRLGSAYLDRMLKRFDGSYPMAAAAYNAGPGRVDQWIETYGDPRKGEIDLIDWIEMMPIYETRNYVQRVIEATHVYRLRMK